MDANPSHHNSLFFNGYERRLGRFLGVLIAPAGWGGRTLSQFRHNYLK